ncbi:hypothetical protein TRFO_03737 [Tritrichomonas foetus]|uniref:Uncharacterized protein n=1 Tax=Tritrichomonas foetus TaxID=1144522 RepID=A0A1J4KRM2_9EUKA|nr:hypothetical protein TRFO_03737 [Tritrichomonas foetus]|eukprot:OHT12109.1 hypothetical protein TRFO_03737 [Tritrichomonas foetus]
MIKLNTSSNNNPSTRKRRLSDEGAVVRAPDGHVTQINIINSANQDAQPTPDYLALNSRLKAELIKKDKEIDDLKSERSSLWSKIAHRNQKITQLKKKVEELEQQRKNEIEEKDLLLYSLRTQMEAENRLIYVAQGNYEYQINIQIQNLQQVNQILKDYLKKIVRSIFPPDNSALDINEYECHNFLVNSPNIKQRYENWDQLLQSFNQQTVKIQELDSQLQSLTNDIEKNHQVNKHLEKVRKKLLETLETIVRRFIPIHSYPYPEFSQEEIDNFMEKLPSLAEDVLSVPTMRKRNEILEEECKVLRNKLK